MHTIEVKIYKAPGLFVQRESVTIVRTAQSREEAIAGAIGELAALGGEPLRALIAERTELARALYAVLRRVNAPESGRQAAATI